MAKVQVYVSSGCPYCVRAMTLLRKKKVEFEVIDLTGDQQGRIALRERTGQHTVPQIFINGQSVGGSDDLAALDAAGKLDTLLAAEA